MNVVLPLKHCHGVQMYYEQRVISTQYYLLHESHYINELCTLVCVRQGAVEQCIAEFVMSA